jgi:hypothetical protein
VRTMIRWVQRLLGRGGNPSKPPSRESGIQASRPVEAQEGQRQAREGRLCCPACGSDEALPFIYGAPTHEHMRLCVQGKAAAGGGMGRLLTGRAPTWRCGRCKHEWRGGLFGGGAGTSLEDAVVICGITSSAVGIRAEKQWLTERLGLDRDVAGQPSGWTVEQQSLVQGKHRFYDMLTISLPNGTRQVVFFDVTCFFGRIP